MSAHFLSVLGIAIGIIGIPLGALLWIAAKLSASARRTERAKNIFAFSFLALIAGLFAIAWLPEEKKASWPTNVSAPSSSPAEQTQSTAAPPASAELPVSDATQATTGTTGPSCDVGTPTNVEYRVHGQDISIRTGPGNEFKRVVNKKATDIMHETQYATVDSTVTVRELCRHEGWSQIVVIVPDWLSESHRGWVASKYLVAMRDAAAGFVDDNFVFDEKTVRYKDIIIKGVNKIRADDSRCSVIDPTSAYISSKGTRSNPVFFVTCGSGANAVNVFFSKADVESGKTFQAPRHVDQAQAIQACEDYAKSQATHPSTVDFSRLWNLQLTEAPNGNTRVTSTFTAKNAFNLELNYNIVCLMNAEGLFEAAISEAR